MNNPGNHWANVPFFVIAAGLYGFMVLLTFGPSGTNRIFVILAIFVVGVYYLIDLQQRHNRRQQRPAQFDALVGRHGYKRPLDVAAVTLSYNLTELGKDDAWIGNSLAGEGWAYADYQYGVYRNTRNGRQKVKDVYYSVLQLSLPRALPNVLFDSPKTHKRQFKYMFDSSQAISLEGNFDKHFTTYFPAHYNVDGLAIITPEIMEAMIQADDFDIEISQDKLYLYGPQLPVQSVPDMITRGQAVYAKLLNNILTYRDERLPGITGRQNVAFFGAQLRRNPNVFVPPMVIGAGLFGGAVVFSLMASGEDLMNVFWMAAYGIGIGGVAAYKYFSLKSEHAHMDKLHAWARMHLMRDRSDA